MNLLRRQGHDPIGRPPLLEDGLGNARRPRVPRGARIAGEEGGGGGQLTAAGAVV